jgi:hypothetical protein
VVEFRFIHPPVIWPRLDKVVIFDSKYDIQIWMRLEDWLKHFEELEKITFNPCDIANFGDDYR